MIERRTDGSLRSMQPIPRVAVIATSPDPASRSRILAGVAADKLARRSCPADLLDLHDHPLPAYAPSAPQDATVERARTILRAATSVLFAVPIYNWDVNAAAKNLIEWVGGELTGKTVGFLCAAGGHHSYMSVLPFANSLMLDYRCWIVPRFVYAVGQDFSDGGLVSEAIDHRVGELVDTVLTGRA
jgi:NAD(P)H-dependent FMN reductase